MTKRILVLLLGCVLITSFALSSVLAVNAPVKGSNEFFGAAKTILVKGGIDWKLKTAYVQQDTVVWNLPPGYLFKDATYYVARSDNGGATWATDSYPVPTIDGQVDFQPIAGGQNSNTITFRVTPSAIGITGDVPEAANSVWRLVTQIITPVKAMPAGADWIRIQVPMQTVKGTPAGWAGSNVPVWTQGYTFFTMIPYDASNRAAFLTLYDEYQVTSTAGTSQRTIDVAAPSLRTHFTGGNVNSRLDFEIERNPAFTSVVVDVVPGPYENPVTLYLVDTADKFVVKSAGNADPNYVGIDTVDLLHPAVTVPPDGAIGVFGPPTIFSIPGTGTNWDGALNVANHVRYSVDGVTVLDDRGFDFSVAFAPATAKNFNAFEYLNLVNAWLWRNNGAQFRSQFAVSAVDSGYNTAFRIGNFGIAPAPVYADIWMDDGQKVTNVLITSGLGIAANGFQSWTFASICSMAAAQKPGFTYSTTWPSQSAKGRIRFSVLAADANVSAYEQYVAGTGSLTTVVLERLINGFWVF